MFLSFSFSTIGSGSSWHHWRLDPHSCPHSHDCPMQKTLLPSLLPLYLVKHLQERERVRHHQLYQVWVLQAQERLRLGQFWRLQDWHSDYLIPIQSGLGFKLGWAGGSTDHDNNNNNSNNSDFKQQQQHGTSYRALPASGHDQWRSCVSSTLCQWKLVPSSFFPAKIFHWLCWQLKIAHCYKYNGNLKYGKNPVRQKFTFTHSNNLNIKLLQYHMYNGNH